MKYLLIFLLIPLAVVNSHAQTIPPGTINATGSTYTQNTGIIFEWSVGELALVETMANSRAIITNGLLQPLVPSQIITNGFFITATNILTPNGDGKNDFWIVKEIEKFPDNEVTVFDRGGRVVFNAKNYQNNWAGQLAGVRLAEDTYYYTIKLKKAGKTGIIRGFITILN